MNKTVRPGDDVQGAVNACSSGDTVTLADGRYPLPGLLQMRTGVTLTGGPAAVLTGGDPSFLLSVENTQGAQLTGFTIDSPRTTAIKVSGSQHALIRGLTIQNVPARAIDFNGGVSAITVTQNTFVNNRGDGVIFGWNATDGCAFTYNAMRNVHEGFHFFWGGKRANRDNCVIRYNQATGVEHFMLEQQGNPVGLDIQYNHVDLWVPQPSQMGFSIATGGDHGGIAENPVDTSYDVVIRNNFIGGQNLRSSGQDAFAAVEAMGWNTQLCYCLFQGAWNAVMLAGLNSPAMALYKIWACGFNNTHGNTNGIAPEDRFVNLASGNIHDVQFLALNAMATPTPGQVFNGGLPWQSDPTGAPPVVINTPTPTPTSATQLQNLAAAVTAQNELTWTWTPVQKALQFKCWATRGTQVLGQGAVPAGGGKVVLANVPDQWEVTCTLYDGASTVGSLNWQYTNDKVPPPPAATPTPTPTTAPAESESDDNADGDNNPETKTVHLVLQTADGGKTWTAVKVN